MHPGDGLLATQGECRLHGPREEPLECLPSPRPPDPPPFQVRGGLRWMGDVWTHRGSGGLGRNEPSGDN
eukprot:13730008-Alexandrium_andersonii.AAC.1